MNAMTEIKRDSPSLFASVILDVAIDKILDYAIPDTLISSIQIGSRVEVPVRGRLTAGYVIDIKKTSSYPTVKPITKLLFDTPLISPDLLKLSLWISRYYCSPLRDIFRILLPPGVRKGMGAKEQLFVMRGKSREELREICISFR